MTARDDATPDGPLAPRSDFMGLEDVTHLAAAGEAPFLRSHQTTFTWFGDQKSRGARGRDRIVDRSEAVRATVANMFGLSASDVGFAYNVAHASNMLVGSLTAAQRSNVVMQRWEYPSMMYPWARLKDVGWEVRLLSDESNLLNYEELSECIDSETAAIIVSHVSYLTAERVDLRRLREIADSVGALLVVDASHSLGVLEADWSLVDFMFSCCYKWLLGCHGVAIAYCNRSRLPTWRPRDVGWSSVEWQDAAERGGPLVERLDGHIWELGNPGLLSVCILGSALDYLARFESNDIEDHVLGLNNELRLGLIDLGLDVMTPSSRDARAGSVAFKVGDETAWRRSLEESRVLGWTSDNRVRLSTHIYNDRADVTRAISAVAAAVRTIGQSSIPASAKQMPR
jgi:cysteine desulfurase / selenocysteine lyase